MQQAQNHPSTTTAASLHLKRKREKSISNNLKDNRKRSRKDCGSGEENNSRENSLKTDNSLKDSRETYLLLEKDQGGSSNLHRQVCRETDPDLHRS